MSATTGGGDGDDHQQRQQKQIAKEILRQKTPTQAFRIFRALKNTHPQTAHVALAKALLSFRRPAAALRALSSTSIPLPDAILSTFARSLGPHHSSKLLNLYANQHQQEQHSIQLLNSILDTLVCHNIDSARDFFRRKISQQANEKTYGILMKGLCQTNRISEAFKLLQLFKSRFLQTDPVIYNTMLHALCRNGKIGRARSLYTEITNPTAVTFNILISGYCADGNVVQALVMLENCFDVGLVPDMITVTKLVEILCDHGRGKEAVEVLERVESNGGKVDVVAYNTLITGFCKMGKPNVAKKVLKEMESKGCLPNLHTYNALISGLCSSGKLESAVDVFEEMKFYEIEPSFETLDCLIRALCSGGRTGEAMKFLNMLEEDGKVQLISISPYNSVLYGFYKETRVKEACKLLERMASYFPRAVQRTSSVLNLCGEGKIGEAKKLYDQMICEGDVPNAFLYARLVEGLCEKQDVKEAFNLMNDMVERGFFPVASTFNGLIQGFCQEGNVPSACKFLEEMLKRGCSTNAASYNPLILALCREGNIKRATTYLEKMIGNGIVPDCFTWESFMQSEVLCIRNENEIHIDDTLKKLLGR